MGFAVIGLAVLAAIVGAVASSSAPAQPLRGRLGGFNNPGGQPIIMPDCPPGAKRVTIQGDPPLPHEGGVYVDNQGRTYWTFYRKSNTVRWVCILLVNGQNRYYPI